MIPSSGLEPHVRRAQPLSVWDRLQATKRLATRVYECQWTAADYVSVHAHAAEGFVRRRFKVRYEAIDRVERR